MECPECGRSVTGVGKCILCVAQEIDKQSTERKAKVRASAKGRNSGICDCCDRMKDVLILTTLRMENTPRTKTYSICSNCRRSYQNNDTLSQLKGVVLWNRQRETRKEMGRLSKDQQAIASGRVALLSVPVEDRSVYSFIVGYVAGTIYFNNDHKCVDIKTKACIIERDPEGLPIIRDGNVRNEWCEVTFRVRERSLIYYLDNVPPEKIGPNEVPGYLNKPICLIFEVTRPANDGRVWWDTTLFTLNEPSDYPKAPRQYATNLNKLLLEDEQFINNFGAFKERNGYTPDNILRSKDNVVSSVAVSGGYGVEKAVAAWRSFIGLEPITFPEYYGKKEDNIPF